MAGLSNIFGGGDQEFEKEEAAVGKAENVEGIDEDESDPQPSPPSLESETDGLLGGNGTTDNGTDHDLTE